MTALVSEIPGMAALLSKLTYATLVAVPEATFLEAAATTIEAAAKPKVPPSDGFSSGLRDDLRHSVDVAAHEAHIGNSKSYAPYVHGYFDSSAIRTRPHWPPFGPGTALAGWASAHGIPPFLVARAISIKGSPLVPYLRDALNESETEIAALLQEMGYEIAAHWMGGAP